MKIQLDYKNAWTFCISFGIIIMIIAYGSTIFAGLYRIQQLDELMIKQIELTSKKREAYLSYLYFLDTMSSSNYNFTDIHKMSLYNLTMTEMNSYDRYINTSYTIIETVDFNKFLSDYSWTINIIYFLGLGFLVCGFYYLLKKQRIIDELEKQTLIDLKIKNKDQLESFINELRKEFNKLYRKTKNKK